MVVCHKRPVSIWTKFQGSMRSLALDSAFLCMLDYWRLEVSGLNQRAGPLPLSFRNYKLPIMKHGEEIGVLLVRTGENVPDTIFRADFSRR